MVTVFFACLVLLSLLIASIGLLVLLRALFESVWGGCGWRGNRVGRGVRWVWGFGCGLRLEREEESRVYFGGEGEGGCGGCGRVGERV